MRYLIICLAILSLGCTKKLNEQPSVVEPPAPSPDLTYLALGDSYTIGQSVAVDERFPHQLTDSLRGKGVNIETPLIIAKTGWTTADLEAGIVNADIEGDTFDLVTLLIGVNNQYRGYDINTYGPAFQALLEKAIEFAGGRKDRVFVLSIPDYGVTPFGQQRPNADQISEEIDAYNAINRQISGDLGITYFDITPISREALNDPELIASDDLHPSGKMYQGWVSLMLSEVLSRLKQ